MTELEKFIENNEPTREEIQAYHKVEKYFRCCDLMTRLEERLNEFEDLSIVTFIDAQNEYKDVIEYMQRLADEYDWREDVDYALIHVFGENYD